MKKAWFYVTCEIDNGIAVKQCNRVVYAPTASSAKSMAKAGFMTGEEGIVKVISIRKVPE